VPDDGPIKLGGGCVVYKWVIACWLGLGCLGAALSQPATHSWQLHLPGLSYHFDSPEQAGKSWNQFHDGLGLQHTRVQGKQVRRLTAGFMRDSFNKQGLYLGAAFGWRLLDGAYRADVSAAPMLLYRAVKFDTSDRKLIPIVLPMLSLEHRATGLGANITVLPGGNLGKELKFPGLIYFQLTLTLR